MRLLIDLGSIKTGGGVQLATNFLNWLCSADFSTSFSSVFLLLPEKGGLVCFKSNSYFLNKSIIYPDSYIKRKVFEVVVLPAFISQNDITHIFTFFGSGLPRFKGVKSLVSLAYPIICYPDSLFWKFAPFKLFVRQKIINYLRCQRIKKADRIIVETEVMKDRIVFNLVVNSNNVLVFPPVVTSYVSFVDNLNLLDKTDTVIFLFLSGLDQHKNLWRLPELAYHLNNAGITDFIFRLTVNKLDYFSKYSEYISPYKEFVLKHFDFIGSQPSTEIDGLYSNCHFLVNVSDLESFSNNYMEAWKASVPLICSDTDFARHICRDSAVYISQHDMKYSAEIIKTVVYDNDKRSDLVSYGKIYLNQLPTITQRYEFILNTLMSL